jgi:hypothetical protein
MKKYTSKTLLVILAFVSVNLYSQDVPDEESNEKEETIIKEIDRVTRIGDEARDRARSSERSSARSSGRERERYSTSYSFGDGIYVMSNSGNSSSQLSLSKSFEGESKKNEGSFDVDETVRNITLTLSGEVETGEIKIKLILSNGDIIKELTIDESADIRFNQSIKINEKEKKYYGKWRYTVEAVNAEGEYRLSIGTK